MSGSIRVVELDLHDPPADLVEEVAVFLRAIHAEVSPADPPITAEYARTRLHSGSASVRMRRLVAYLPNDGSTIVGMAEVLLEVVGDNIEIAEFFLEAHPDHRRVGIGTALLAASAQLAQEENRSSIAAWGTRSEASLAFWDAMGMPEVQVDRMSRVAVAGIPDDLMGRWIEGCAARGLGYRLERWVGRCPDDLMPAYVATQEGMNDAPKDDLDMAPPPMDEAWNRAREQNWENRGGEIRVIVAIDPEGQPAGMTEIMRQRSRPWFVMQQGTTTLRPFRKQGIGRWLKAEMYRWIVADIPEASVIETGNADSNVGMLAINTEMGFARHIGLTTRQLPTDEVLANLANLANLARAVRRCVDPQ